VKADKPNVELLPDADIAGFCTPGRYIETILKAGSAPYIATPNSARGVAYRRLLDIRVKVS
jgi:hypothetical protein